MSKLFGEFLVSRSLISESDLLDVLLDQISNLPSVPEILRKSHLLSDRDLLRAIKHQSESRQSFIESCTELGIWNSTLEAHLECALDAYRVPLGQILVSRGKIQAQQLAQALSEFFSQIPDEDLPPVQDYSNAFSEVRRRRGEAFFTVLASTGKIDEPFAERLLQTIYHLRGSARLANLTQTEQIWIALEQTLRAFQQAPAASQTRRVWEFAELGNSLWSLAWRLRGALLPQNDEKAAWKELTPVLPETLSRLQELLHVLTLEATDAA